MLCASFSSVRKRMLFYSVWLSISSQELRPFVLTHPGLGKFTRRWCINLTRSPTSPEKQTGSPPLCGAVLGKAACYLPPVLHPGDCPEHVTRREAGNRQRWWLLLCYFALQPEDPKCVVWRCGFFFGTFSKHMSIFLRDSLNKVSPEGRNLLL